MFQEPLGFGCFKACMHRVLNSQYCKEIPSSRFRVQGDDAMSTKFVFLGSFFLASAFYQVSILGYPQKEDPKLDRHCA